jgi:hypothetical protein
MRHANNNVEGETDLFSPKELAQSLAGALLLVSLALFAVQIVLPAPML